MNRMMVYGIAALIVLGMIAGFWLNYRHIIDQNAELAAANAEVTAALRSSEAATQAAIQTIDQWSAEQARTQDSIDSMAAQQIEATKETRRLNSIFSKHDLERLARAKPILIERRINLGASRAWGLLQQTTNPDRDRPGKAGTAQTNQAPVAIANPDTPDGVAGRHPRDDPVSK